MDITDHDISGRCDRCDQPTTARITSYFIEETICMECLHRETDLLENLRSHGVDASSLGGCGYLPRMEVGK